MRCMACRGDRRSRREAGPLPLTESVAERRGARLPRHGDERKMESMKHSWFSYNLMPACIHAGWLAGLVSALVDLLWAEDDLVDDLSLEADRRQLPVVPRRLHARVPAQGETAPMMCAQKQAREQASEKVSE